MLMLKSELVRRISAQNSRLFQRDVEKIRGVGTFSIRKRPARTGRNPRNGAHVQIDAKSVPYFRTAKEMRERMNRA
jgi:integration host factor subunit beta